MRFISYIVFFVSITTAYAADIPMEFEDAGQQQRYQQLLEELRCLVCQNQTLADSHADLAQDLRTQVYNMVDEGRTNQAIIDFLVQRYGDFVLYRPRVNVYTILLWFGPFILLIIGLITVYRLARKARPGDVTLNQEERSVLSSLLDDNGTEKRE
jgi:cytochrome c-type biogenesis protein CcmH